LTMAFSWLLLLLDALLMMVLPFASAFGPRLEPFPYYESELSSSRGDTGQSSRLPVNDCMRRSTQSPRTSHETDETMSFEQLLDDFDFPLAAYQNLNDYFVAHLREKADLLASKTFGAKTFGAKSRVTEASEEKWAGSFDDEECLIPEEWKSVPTMVESIDVMEFLGITRVRPLVVSATVFPDS
jgi:hypothetical protein